MAKQHEKRFVSFALHANDDFATWRKGNSSIAVEVHDDNAFSCVRAVRMGGLITFTREQVEAIALAAGLKITQ